MPQGLFLSALATACGARDSDLIHMRDGQNLVIVENHCKNIGNHIEKYEKVKEYTKILGICRIFLEFYRMFLIEP